MVFNYQLALIIPNLAKFPFFLYSLFWDKHVRNYKVYTEKKKKKESTNFNGSCGYRIIKIHTEGSTETCLTVCQKCT